MHIIALCTPCIILFNCGHLLHMRVYHAEHKSKIQAKRVQTEYDGPPATSCMDTNLAIGSRQALVHQTTVLEFCLPLYLNYDSCLCIKL
jgi:hypothetical protein